MTTSTTTVTQWIDQHARPLTSLDPSGPLTDLTPLREMVGDARVVALGASTRDAHEFFAIEHRVTRFLVEDMDFRSIALEGDDAASTALDEYVRTGTGDPRAIFTQARSFWRFEELLAIVEWARHYNLDHPDDPVRIAHPDPDQHVTAQSGDLGDIEKMLADNVIEWQKRTGDKIVYWGGTAHTAGAATRTVLLGDQPVTHRNMGGYLRQHFGPDYVSMALTFDHGRTTYVFPSPPVDFAESALGGTNTAYVLNLHTAAPDEVREWLNSPAKTRLIGPVYDPDHDADHHLSGGSLAEWFDVIVHQQTVTPAHPIG
ncbi:putative erythromycin esterase [Nocardia nova SH22a]|uniref:Putative erythromycin esterase n=1 Tax=Nocardia nova SH22a TaxID=1415166 RepID=W5T7F6_9NOCA|nr:erythromycin esterase family protein [Nocardia nova]AHH15084.1 putative erythromycin esterase [Nocardia nova SH22a]